MKKLSLLITLAFLSVSVTYSQYSAVVADPSFRYVATPGFINITEFTYGYGTKDTTASNAQYYYGITNIFGYQIDRNFSGGIGVGFLHYDAGNLFPIYLEYKYNLYFKRFTPYLYGDGGALISTKNFSDESKIFINPGIGISRALSPKFEINISAGYMIQSRSSLTRITYFNFKAGIIFRNNAFRMFRNEKIDV
jgi:hypothetical protein